MTYRLEPFLEKIISPVTLIFQNGNRQKYMNGKNALEQAFSEKYIALSMKAVGGIVKITVIPAASPDENRSFF